MVIPDEQASWAEPVAVLCGQNFVGKHSDGNHDRMHSDPVS